jgi:hypothetical protein
VYVPGSLSHDQFWTRLPPKISDRAAAVAYATEHRFRPGANGFVDQLRESLRREAHALDSSVHEFGVVSLGKDGRPIVSPIQRVEPPPSAIELERTLLDRMPERSVLCALANTQHWAGWDRHFGLPSRLDPQIRDAANRYILPRLLTAAVSVRRRPRVTLRETCRQIICVSSIAVISTSTICGPRPRI